MSPTDSRLAPLLPFIDPMLPSAEQVALLGLQRGLQGRQLSVLPGLANATRLRAALEGLRTRGRLASRENDPVPGQPVERRKLNALLKTRKKLRHALALLLRPAAALHARDLTAVADALGPERSDALEAVLRACDARQALDRQVDRDLRTARFAYVERRIPEGTRRARKTAGRVAPPDLVELTVRAITDKRSGRSHAGQRDHVVRLHDALSAQGEYLLAHWWEILQFLQTRGLRGSKLGLEWRLYLESLMLRRRVHIPSDLWLTTEEEPRLLKFRRPVPDCGLGPWVEEERRLYRAMRQMHIKAVGPQFAKILWHMAHRRTRETLVRHYGPDAVNVLQADSYDVACLAAAEDLVREAVGPLGPSLEGKRWNHKAEWRAYLERRALRKAVRMLKERDPADVDVHDQARSNWPVRMLLLAVLRHRDEAHDLKEWERLLEAAQAPGANPRWPRQRRAGERVVRDLLYQHRTKPLLVDAKVGAPFPMDELVRRIRRSMAHHCTSPTERDDALARVRECLANRPLVDVVYVDGTVHEHTLVEAGRLCHGQPVLEPVLERVAEPCQRAA